MDSLARTIRSGHFVIVTLAALLVGDGAARACGCFANPPPTPASTPNIQAGERILFAVDRGQVTAHIQIAWRGDAAEFGWLLPLPSVPTVEVGTDELFARLEAATTPTFQVTRTFTCRDNSTDFCLGQGDISSDLPPLPFDAGAPHGPLVVKDSVGPYDFAVLKADDKQAMIQWLADNRFMVPATSDAALIPYFHPGAYFLALKLKSGKSSGDLQPIVVHYASDLPMIPITLTSIGAIEHMGILVWILGSARAIPRNYLHTVLDEAAVDWNSGRNYDDLVIRAVAEAPQHHTFITEYAGTSGKVLANQPTLKLALDALAQTPDATAFVDQLRDSGLPYPFTGALKAILAAHIPKPVEINVTADAFAADMANLLDAWKRSYPNAAPIQFDPVATAMDLDARVIKPREAAGKLLGRFPYLTRLHTALSPSEMTADPVFSFNPSLPEVGTAHLATLETACDTSYLLTQGTSTEWPSAQRPTSADRLPASLRIERLREAGPPEVVTDNTGTFNTSKSGCAVGERRSRTGRYGSLLLAGLALVAVRLRSRRR